MMAKYPQLLPSGSVSARGMFPRGRYCNTLDLRKQKNAPFQDLVYEPTEATNGLWVVPLTVDQTPWFSRRLREYSGSKGETNSCETHSDD
ncbi:hypothetical protein MTR67_017764 [Solanum verrucosum]|uniref:Uncharacterized protein n=1 Tax=Solanum verrucosum TaxID=315347 RepID=A0AAF0QQY7_SOLVR|nr:hypothetical protein MTR67_017764 [Solanum verrucosum]